jgi:hypothetical protein
LPLIAFLMTARVVLEIVAPQGGALVEEGSHDVASSLQVNGVTGGGRR